MRYDELKTYTYNANGLLSSVTNKDGTTDLTWDILMGDGVVISASINGEETNYTYGLERISAQTDNGKTEYVYDGRGSVAAEVSYNNSWYTLGGALSKKAVTTKSYTPFGEQIGEAVSGFGYNGEYYNAATGMVYLRARFYEPAMNRFSQKDIIRGSITAPNSLNRYTYVQNDPVNFIDPSGQSLKSAWNMVKSSVTNTVKNIVSNPVQAVKSAAKAVVNAVTHPIKTATYAAKSAGNAVRTIYNEVRTPDSQSKYASPATNRGTGSSYSGSSGGGAYTAPVYSPYDSNGNATSYFNSSYQSGKAPSPDAPRIEDVTADSVYYCSIAKRVPNTNALGAGDYSGIGDFIEMTVNGVGKVVSSVGDYINSIEKVGPCHYQVKIDSTTDAIIYGVTSLVEITADTLAIFALYAGATAVTATIPTTAGGSAVIAYVFLEAGTMAGIDLVSDAVSSIKNIATYTKEGDVVVEMGIDFSKIKHTFDNAISKIKGA